MKIKKLLSATMILASFHCGSIRVSADGLHHLQAFFESGDPAKMQAAADDFQQRVTASPNDYPAKVYAAFTKIYNLINDKPLKDLMQQFGFTYIDLGGEEGWDLDGELTFTNAPLSNDAIDSIWQRCHPAVDEAYALLDSIPSGWTGFAEISPDYFPVDEMVYADYPDVVAAKAMLKAMRSFLNTVRAYHIPIDYQKIDWPVTLPIKSIPMAGGLSDWDNVPVQLVGEEGNELRRVKACIFGNTLFTLIEISSSLVEGWSDVDIQVKIDGEVRVLDAHYRFEQGSVVDASFEIGGSEIYPATARIVGNFLETACELPDPMVLNAAGKIHEVDILRIEREEFGWEEWKWSELSYPEHAPARRLIDLFPDALNSVRNEAAMTQAKTDLTLAVSLGRTAGNLIKNRTGNQLHFFEYDPEDEEGYDEVMDLLADIETSLSRQVLFTSDDGTRDVTVHLGAFYTAPYVTRAMLPEYSPEALLNAPSENTFPDPTFGGVFPSVTQQNITALLNGYPLSVPAPQIAAGQKTSMSKVTLTWDLVKGADSYQVWRSPTPDRKDAVLVSDSVSEGSFTDSSLDSGTTYYYWVRGMNPYQAGSFNATAVPGVTRQRLAMPWLNLLLE
jgi:hypothetical protein